MSDFAGAALSAFGGALVVAELVLDALPLSGDFMAVLPELLAFARQASFSAAGRFAHAFVASLSPFAGAVVAGLSAAGAAAGELGLCAPAAIAVPSATTKASCLTCIRIMFVSSLRLFGRMRNARLPARFDSTIGDRAFQV